MKLFQGPLKEGFSTTLQKLFQGVSKSLKKAFKCFAKALRKPLRSVSEIFRKPFGGLIESISKAKASLRRRKVCTNRLIRVALVGAVTFMLAMFTHAGGESLV